MFGLSRDYRPRGRFDGRCILVRVEGSELMSTWKATPMLGWEPWCGPGSAVVRVAATHDTMLRAPAVVEVGKALSSLL
jgi:thioesterase domain-containing protein